MPTTTLAFPDDDPNGVRHGYLREGHDATMAALEQNGPIKPAPYFADVAADADLRLLRQADAGELYLGRETGVWFRRSELGRFLVRADGAAELHARGLIGATRPVPRTRWLEGELTDAGRALLAGSAAPRRRVRVPRAERDLILSEPYRLWVMGEGPRPTATEESPMSQTPQETIRSATECLNMLDGLQSRANQTPAEAQVYVRERARQEQRLADARRAA